MLSGRATTETTTPRHGVPSDRIVVKFTDIFDATSIARIHHTASCGWCRRLWSTLQFRHSFADDQVWAGLVSEFLKLLGTTGVQSEYKFIYILSWDFGIFSKTFFSEMGGEEVWWSKLARKSNLLLAVRLLFVLLE